MLLHCVMGNFFANNYQSRYATDTEMDSQPDKLTITISEGQWYYSTLFQVSAQWAEDKSYIITVGKTTTISEFLTLCRQRGEYASDEPIRLSLETRNTVESSPYTFQSNDPVSYIDCIINVNEPIVRLRVFDMCQVKVSFSRPVLHEDRII